MGAFLIGLPSTPIAVALPKFVLGWSAFTSVSATAVKVLVTVLETFTRTCDVVAVPPATPRTTALSICEPFEVAVVSQLIA